MTIKFKLREADRLDVSIVDGADRVVRTIERDRDYAQGPVEIEWDGRDDAGKVLPEGEYKPRIRLRRRQDDLHAPESDPDRRDGAAARARLRPADGLLPRRRRAT